MKRFLQMLLMATSLVAARADALDKDAIVRLLRAGVSEDTIILIVQRENSQYALTVDDVVDLKDVGASDRLINALVSRNTVSRLPTMSSEVIIHSAAVPKDHGLLLIKNECSWPLTFAWDSDRKNIYVHRGPSSLTSVSLGYGQTTQITLRTGTWDVAWLGQDEALEVKIKEGRTSVLTLRAERDGSIVGIYSYDGVIRDSGVLWTAVDRESERQLQRELERAREATEELARATERLRSERTTVIIEKRTYPCPPPAVVVKPFVHHPPVVIAPQPPVVVKPFPSHPPVVVCPPSPPPPVVVKPFPSHPPVVVVPQTTSPSIRRDGWSIWFGYDRNRGWWNW